MIRKLLIAGTLVCLSTGCTIKEDVTLSDEPNTTNYETTEDITLPDEPNVNDYETTEEYKKAYDKYLSEYWAAYNEKYGECADKPVIYLYPEEKTEVNVKLDFSGELTCTYPAYENGWEVIAEPDGTLTNTADGKEYSYLYWEGVSQTEWDMSKGFVVKGEDTAEFLQETLEKIGLTPKEYNEFIVYWLPQMQDNPYNLITFQQEAYTDTARLEITPEPDSILRVFMAYQALNAPVEVESPEIETFTRDGFTVVEWGGTEVQE